MADHSLAVGDRLLPMPILLDADRYLKTPLEKTYLAAFHGMPEFLQKDLTRRKGKPRRS